MRKEKNKVSSRKFFSYVPGLLCLFAVFMLVVGETLVAAQDGDKPQPYAVDKIILKNKTVLEGKIIEERDGQVIIQLADGKATMGIPRSDILSVVMAKPESFVKAQEAFKKKRFQEAIASYNEVISQYGRSEWVEKALIGVGRAYVKLKKLDDARKIFERFLSEYKSSEFCCEAGLILGKILEESNLHDRARKVYGEVLEKDCSAKDSVGAQFNIGEIDLAKQEYEQALMGFLRVVVVFADQGEFVQKAMLKSGFCYEKLGEPVYAKKIYEELVTEYPKGKYAREAKEKLEKSGGK